MLPLWLRFTADAAGSANPFFGFREKTVTRPAALFVLLGALVGAGTRSTYGQTITVTNVTANQYAYDFFPSDCPAGYNIPSGQYPAADHLERGHVIYNHTTGQWVYWAHFDNGGYSLAQVAVFKSASECGPYILQSTFAPYGLQSRDENIFEDDDGSAYLITASSKNGGANDTMAILKMTPDYLGIDSTAGVTWLFENDYREAPVVMKKDNVYFLVTSQAAGWFPSQGGYAAGTAMLGASNWGPLTNLGDPSTYGGQTSGGFTIHGTQQNAYVLTFDHLGGNTLRDTGGIWLPLLLDSTTKTATLNWYTSWQVDLTTGLLTLPSFTDGAIGSQATSSVASAANGPAAYAVDGSYATRWAGAANGASAFPASLTIDLGVAKPIQEVDLSWYQVKGSEPYYKYTIGYSNDGATYTTLDYTGNILYGFTHDAVDFTARYVRITETGFVCQNGCGFYGPSLYEAALRVAPASRNLPVNVTVMPSSTKVAFADPLTVTVGVSGGSGNPVPSGTVTLAAPGYSATYGLVNGSDTFQIAPGALLAGIDTLTATYTPDPTSAPTYGTSTTAGTTTLTAGAIPVTPANLVVSADASGKLLLTWTASPSAVSYTVNRSINDGPFSVTTTQATTSYIDSGLANDNTTYCYTISATNGLGTSPASAAVCGTPTSSFLTVPNFSFETPVTGSYIYNATGGIWGFMPSTSTGGSGVTTNNSPFTAGDAVAPDGQQVAFLQQTGAATQTISGFTVGSPYTIFVSASQRQNEAGQVGNTFDIRVNGAAIGSFAPLQSVATYTDYSASFTATAATNTVSLAGTNLRAPGMDNTVFVDNIRILTRGTQAIRITAPAASAEDGTSTLLTATASFSGPVPPTGTLLFQVGAGDQVPAACVRTGSTWACTATYDIAGLQLGVNTITISYAGDANYAPATASAQLTVTPWFMRPRVPLRPMGATKTP